MKWYDHVFLFGGVGWFLSSTIHHPKRKPSPPAFLCELKELEVKQDDLKLPSGLGPLTMLAHQVRDWTIKWEASLVDPMGSVGEKHGIIKKTSWVVSTFFHFYPEPWEMIQFDRHIFWMGWVETTNSKNLSYHQNSMIRGCDIWHSCFLLFGMKSIQNVSQGFFWNLHPWKIWLNLKVTPLKRKLIFHPPPWLWGSKS